ncbi:hypothetical protein TNCV_4375431 [Trichonephila clavipes]|uniref:Uncharacterized protein n=1 Tax=Trichonephila clavipes TaxID=2585209 RepID=A0A8X6W1Y4_TRICX|nr:hypothetical protein TNCV_4375431 [Trichonephila clavipes]
MEDDFCKNPPFIKRKGRKVDGNRARNYEPRSNNEESTELSSPSLNYHRTPTRAILFSTGLTCMSSSTRRVFKGTETQTCDMLVRNDNN